MGLLTQSTLPSKKSQVGFGLRADNSTSAVYSNQSKPKDSSLDKPERKSLEALIAAISEHRDKRAFVELFNETSPRLKAFAMQCGANANDAEELVQECMLSVWRKAHTFKPSSGTAITWLYTIIRNRRIDFARKGRLETVSSDDLWHEEAGEALETQVDNEISGQKARKLLYALPEEQKQVVFKVYFEGKSHSEISKDLELPLGTIKSRLRLAMIKLDTLAKEQM